MNEDVINQSAIAERGVNEAQAPRELEELDVSAPAWGTCGSYNL